MSTREAIIAAIKRGEQYKNIASDIGCSKSWVSMVGISSGIRRYAKGRVCMKQVMFAIPIELIEELKSRGQMSYQIREAISEYLERKRDGQSKRTLLRSNGKENERVDRPRHGP